MVPAMTMKRTGESWKSADEYGHTLPYFTVNLLVRDLQRSIAFYREVLGAVVTYSDPDFAALKLTDLEFMLHADHAYDHHAWFPDLARGERRGLGAELRLFQTDPDLIESRARKFGATILQPSRDMPHGWRDVIIADPDGYTWAVGMALGTQCPHGKTG
jgi:catechol 2,3-dioxygenase-like lactoylglutathione lyase family enzyme